MCVCVYVMHVCVCVCVCVCASVVSGFRQHTNTNTNTIMVWLLLLTGFELTAHPTDPHPLSPNLSFHIWGSYLTRLIYHTHMHSHTHTQLAPKQSCHLIPSRPWGAAEFVLWKERKDWD